MSVQNAAGDPVSKSTLLAQEVTDGRLTLGEDLFSVVSRGGRSQRRLLGRAGAQVTPAQVQTWYPAPVLQSVTPAICLAAGGVTVKLVGADIGHVTAVTFGGIAATNVNVINGYSLTCTTPAHSAGPVAIALTAGSAPVTVNGLFSYVATPVLRSLTPSALWTDGGELLTIFGEGLVAGAAVTVGGQDAAEVAVAADARSLTCLSPGHAASATQQRFDVVVTTPGGAATLADAVFYFDSQNAPHITSVSPTSGPPDTEVTCTGRNFTALGGVETVAAHPPGYTPNSRPGRVIGAAVTVDSATQLTVQLDHTANIAALDDSITGRAYLIFPATADFEGTSEATFTLTAAP